MQKIRFKTWHKVLLFFTLPVIAGVSTGIFSYFHFAKKEKEPENTLKINKLADNYDHEFSNLLNRSFVFLEDEKWQKLFGDEIEIARKIPEFSEANFEYKKTDKGINYISYNDPYTGVRFNDYSYGKDEEGFPRYLLKENGLLLLAHNFKRKSTFGSEVNLLKSINVNKPGLTKSTERGSYAPSLREININGLSLAEKGLKLDTKVRFLTNTIFHEYMHHWAYVYITRSNLISEIEGLKDYYVVNSNDSDLKANLKIFQDNFKEILGYNTEQPVKLDQKNEDNKLIFLKYGLKDLFNYGDDKTDIENGLYFFSGENRAASSYDKKRLKYLYGFDELIVREWQKFAYNPDLQKEKKIEYTSETVDNLRIKEGWYGIEMLNDTPFLSDNYTFLPSTYGSDWLRTLYNIYKLKEGSTQIEVSEKNNQIYANNVFSRPERQYLFYSNFLSAMGYGSGISQIFSQSTAIVTGNDELRIQRSYSSDSKNIKFLGYVKWDQNIKSILFTGKDGSKLKADIKKNYVNFFAGNTDYFFSKFSEYGNALAPKPEYASYITKEYIDHTLIDKSKNIQFWDDINNNNVIEDGELIDNISLPEGNLPNNYEEGFSRLTSEKSSIVYLKKIDNKVYLFDK
ncbi:MYPU_1760 family metalloprotease [Mycoplasma sp. Ms02]|uniref:MYPU_1760 family metalloprotease n=1 Tax=Mycoplasma sp. Ms02 TaxID=353851 RepID=UPI001C8A8CAF|nr:hypothetical protein [Mycoplasma sp. Ms02]QZE12099.1 hypothetical protein K4L35_01945 [Mycoplasma sp. Ms02]